jgi:L-ascorbate metabolism protein UlaG (beta-lactamase superfamily)
MTWVLRSWGHSCVSVEGAGHVVVLDPGVWSETAEVLSRATAILVTHDHADHLDHSAVVTALDAVPGLSVWGPSSVIAVLSGAGAPAARLNEVAAGDDVDANGVQVRAVGGAHAVVHADLPVAANLGYVLAGVYHPGDSVLPPGEPVEVLLTPVAGPWLRLADAVDLVRAARPEVVVPIHDAVLSPHGTGLVDRVLAGLIGMSVSRMAVGESRPLRSATA